MEMGKGAGLSATGNAVALLKLPGCLTITAVLGDDQVETGWLFIYLFNFIQHLLTVLDWGESLM